MKGQSKERKLKFVGTPCFYAIFTKGNNFDNFVFAFLGELPYFFAYKMVFFSFQNNPKNLDPSYKTDLDLWDCLGRVKPVLQQN